jgi:hypothetical protein
MSDELIRSLNSRVAELERSLAETRAEAKKHRLAKRQMEQDLAKIADAYESLEKEFEGLQAEVENDPVTADERVQALEKQLKTRDVQDAFRDAGLADGIKFEQVLKFFDVDPLAVDTTKASELLKGWREAAPGLFKQADAAKAEAAPRGATQGQAQGLDLSHLAGRGGRDTSPGSFQVRKSDLTNPEWMRTNQAAYAKAIADKAVAYVDG